jgi:hypothetical protein
MTSGIGCADMTTEPRPAGPPGADRARTTGQSTTGSLLVWRVLSALALLAMGGIHFYLRFNGTGGMLGMLFLLNAVGALVLAVAMLVARGPLLRAATVLSLLFMAGTLLSLVLALTVGLFGLRSSLDYELAPTTLVVESIGTIVLLVTTALVFRPSNPSPGDGWSR